MTEKRFQIKDSNSYHVGYDIIDHQNFYKRYHGGRLVQAEELCDLLNEQHETIQQLQHDASILIQANQDYRRKNEELQKRLMVYQDKVKGLMK